MEILKCKVQDPGFPDSEVTCLKTDDGQTYFFIENGTLKNGNIISTPVLKEGIGHAPYTSLGLITPQGEVLIPFENKNIKPLSNELLLVERNTPVTESVVEALGKQSDPLSASELIETANTIKEQIKSVMGPTGMYAFDNQFSEAALYTTSGVNLANDYFSFIGVNDGAYYMCKNVVGNSIVKYDPYMAVNSEQQEPEVSNNVEVPEEENNQKIETPLAESNEGNSEVSVTPPSIDMPLVENGENITSQEAELSTDAIVPNINMDNAVQEEANNINDSQIEIPTGSILGENQVPTEVSEDTEIEEPTLNITDEEETQQVEQEEPNYVEDTVPEEVNSYEEATSNELSDIFENDSSDDVEEEVNIEDNYQQIETSESEGGFDNIESVNAQPENEEYFEEQIANPIIASATNTIRKLLEENRKQRQVIDRQESEIETLNSSNEILSEENSSKSKEIIALRNSNAKYRSDNNDLTRENGRLKATTKRQEEVIEHLKTQNSALKEQVAGITALSNVVAEANNLFTPSQDETTSSYDSEYGYLGEDGDSFQYTKKAA